MRIRPTKEEFEKKLEQMIRTLQDEIMSGMYKADTYLPSEKSLVKRFRMGNNSIRRGLEQLANEGWIEKVPRVGNRVVGGRQPVHLKLACTNLTERNLEFSRLLHLFQQKYPWIQIEVNTEGGLPGFDNHGNSIGSDVMMMDNHQFQRLLELGAADHFEKQKYDPHLYSFLRPLFSAMGETYMLPVIFSPVVLCYNRTHFQETGLPEPHGGWTWKEAMRNAEALSDGKGRYGMCFHLPSLNRWQVFLLQSGEAFERDGLQLKDLHGTKMLEAIRCSKDVLHNRKAFPQYLFENESDIRRMFWSGKISMTLTTYMGLNGLKDSSLDYDICSIPNLYEPRTLLLSLGIGMNRQSANKKEAQMFIDFMLSEQAQSFIWQHTLSLPSLASLPLKLEEKKLYYPRRYLLYLDIISSYRTALDLQVTTTELNKIANCLKAYWANMSDDDELPEQLQSALTRKAE